MKQKYIDWNPRSATIATITKANEIIEEYAKQGFSLTLRQLYYQFVSRDLIANKQAEYNRLGTIISKGRMAGMVSWDAIEDRTRNLRQLPHWSSASSIVNACAHQFKLDRWANQDYRVEIWIEKDALTGIIQPICDHWDVPYFACRGYNSQSEQKRAAERVENWPDQVTRIIHLGDHDPSGIDMSRDIKDRYGLFGQSIDFVRVALNIDQVQKYNPPPNPAKQTDSRFADYQATYGDDSWELDALSPKIISDIVEKYILDVMDGDLLEETLKEEGRQKEMIKQVARRIT